MPFISTCRPSLVSLFPGTGCTYFDRWMSACRYRFVGLPIWLYRLGSHFPGNYSAFAMERPAWFTGKVPHTLSKITIKTESPCDILFCLTNLIVWNRTCGDLPVKL